MNKVGRALRVAVLEIAGLPQHFVSRRPDLLGACRLALPVPFLKPKLDGAERCLRPRRILINKVMGLAWIVGKIIHLDFPKGGPHTAWKLNESSSGAKQQLFLVAILDKNLSRQLGIGRRIDDLFTPQRSR